MITWSASQVTKARACMRRWAWERVAPIAPNPESEARFQLGRDVHTALELYQREGLAPDRTSHVGRVALVGLPHLPAPNTGTAELAIYMGEGRGFIDLLVPASAVPGWTGLGAEHVFYDYKTKDSFSGKGMFTGRGNFLTDVQALTYARWYFQAHPDQQWVGLRWLYLRSTGRPAARPVDACLGREEVREAFARLVQPTADLLVSIREKGPIEPLQLDPNPLECLRYGPRYACPYISRCNLSPAQKVQGALDMALIDELRAKHANKGINPPESKPEQIQTTIAPQASTPKPARASRAIVDAAPHATPASGEGVYPPVACETQEYQDEQILQACLRALTRRAFAK